MDPLHTLLYKVLQKGSSNRCAGTDIVGIAEQIRPFTLQELLVLFLERHDPSAFEHLLTRRPKQFAELMELPNIPERLWPRPTMTE
jgi:hypothetical protein